VPGKSFDPTLLAQALVRYKEGQTKKMADLQQALDEEKNKVAQLTAALEDCQTRASALTRELEDWKARASPAPPLPSPAPIPEEAATEGDAQITEEIVIDVEEFEGEGEGDGDTDVDAREARDVPTASVSSSSSSLGASSPSSSGPHVCPLCSQTYRSSKDVRRHLRSHHPQKEKKTPSCAPCGKKFATEWSLARHVRNIHSADAPLIHVNASSSTSAQRSNVIEVHPDPSLKPDDIVGKRVCVWWSGDQTWYDGTVLAYLNPAHVVHYDDGEEHAEQLMGSVYPKRGWRLLEVRDV
jgi:uncharacterized C2H2 Zn-finger protein